MNWPTGTEVDADLKLSKVQDLPRDYHSATFATKEVSAVAAIFTSNMDRVVALGRLPSLFIFHWTYLSVLESAEHGSLIDIDDSSAEVDSATAWKAGHHSVDPGSVDHWFRRLPNSGTLWALEGILSSMILGTWTAFESLAGDLWEIAINVHPAELAALRGWEGRISKLSTGETDFDFDTKKQQGEKKVLRLADIDEMTKGSFEVAQSWGTLHRRSGRFNNFQRLYNIRAAYSAAFGRGTDSTAPAIDAALSSTNLDALSLVRNLIAHRAGFADQTYVDAINRVPTIPKLALQEQLKLNGETVLGLVDPVAKVATDLIGAVDRFIAGT